MAEAGTIAGIARAAVCGAVAHAGVVVAAGTAANASVALVARRAAFARTGVGHSIAGNAVVYIQHFVDRCICSGRYPCAVACLAAVAIPIGPARTHAFGAHAVQSLAASVCF